MRMGHSLARTTAPREAVQCGREGGLAEADGCVEETLTPRRLDVIIPPEALVFGCPRLYAMLDQSPMDT